MNRLAIIIPLLSAAGCKKKMDSEDFESRLVKRTEELGLSGAKVSCPKNVEAKAGTSFECTVSTGGKDYLIVTTIKGVEGKQVQLDTQWKNGEAVLSNKLEPSLATQLGTQFGVPVTIGCGEPLRFLDAAGTVTCDLTAGAAKSKVTITFDAGLTPTDWKMDPPLLAKAKLEAILTPSVQGKVGASAVVSCGEEPLLVRPADGIVYCKGTANETGKASEAKLLVEVAEDLSVKRWEAITP